MTRLLPLYVSLAALSLAGCNEKTSEAPEDGRDINTENYPVQTQYSGRVMNGYLEGARVWLDLDGNGLYTPGTIEVELESGSVAVVEGGEPTVVSGENGRFTLDVSSLQQEVTVAPDLDPQDYRLHALVIPGTTTEQTRDGGVTLERAYILSALPGTRNVSPLSTLQARISDFGTADGLTERLGGLNLQDDYIQSSNDRGRTYSSMLTRFMREQLPEQYTEDLRGEDGLSFVVPDDALELLGIALVQNANELLGIVDDAAGGDYANVDVQELELPDLDLELEDPQLLTGQSVSVSGSGSSMERTAEIAFSYGSDARLKTIEADGCMQPTLFEIARLANAGGKIDDTTNQWFPSVSLSEDSLVKLEDEDQYAGVDERLSFDWQNNTASFETRTGCHGGASSGDLDESPEITYSWTLEDDRVVSVTAEDNINGTTRTFTPVYENEGPVFFGYELTESGSTVEQLNLTEEFFLEEGIRECINPPEGQEGYDPDADDLVTATQDYTYQVDGVEAGADSLLYDTRQPRFRLMQFGLPGASLAWGVSEADFPGGFRWVMNYVTSEDDAKKAGLIEKAALADYSETVNSYPDSAPGCWQSPDASSGDAEVSYSYQTLSEYLTGLND